MPQGEVNASLDQEATLAVHRMAGDSAHAWFESLLARRVVAAGGAEAADR